MNGDGGSACMDGGSAGIEGLGGIEGWGGDIEDGRTQI